MPQKFLDSEHPFFKPTWRRYAVVGSCLGWGMLELSMGEGLWAGIFIAGGAYAGWELLLKPRTNQPKD
jgi:hypothetical protein